MFLTQPAKGEKMISNLFSISSYNPLIINDAMIPEEVAKKIVSMVNTATANNLMYVNTSLNFCVSKTWDIEKLKSTTYIVNELKNCGRFDYTLKGKTEIEVNEFIEKTTDNWYKWLGYPNQILKCLAPTIDFACNDLSVKGKWSDKKVLVLARKVGYDAYKPYKFDAYHPFVNFHPL